LVGRKVYGPWTLGAGGTKSISHSFYLTPPYPAGLYALARTEVQINGTWYPHTELRIRFVEFGELPTKVESTPLSASLRVYEIYYSVFNPTGGTLEYALVNERRADGWSVSETFVLTLAPGQAFELEPYVPKAGNHWARFLVYVGGFLDYWCDSRVEILEISVPEFEAEVRIIQISLVGLLALVLGTFILLVKLRLV